MESYGVTVVLSTATQPALDPRKSKSLSLQGFRGLSGPVKSVTCAERTTKNNRTEIVRDVQALHDATRRFKVVLPDFDQPHPSWEELAQRITDGGSSLTIVNARGSARELYAACIEQCPDMVHLSALMCPAHRLVVINDIKRRLAAKEIVRVISTQLVEAGVDLDFPDVYRALAGLDSLAQAGGRCNRNGLLEFGRLIIFEAPNEPLPLALKTPQMITRDILREAHDDLFSLQMFKRFFRELFWRRGDDNLDKGKIRDLLPTDIENVRDICFRTASDRFRIIDDYRKDVIVPWGDEGAEIVERLSQGPNELGISTWRETLRKAQRYCVGINDADYEGITLQGGIRVVGKMSLLDILFYDEVIGVVTTPRPESLII